MLHEVLNKSIYERKEENLYFHNLQLRGLKCQRNNHCAAKQNLLLLEDCLVRLDLYKISRTIESKQHWIKQTLEAHYELTIQIGQEQLKYISGDVGSFFSNSWS